jgi:hypothetical protein
MLAKNLLRTIVLNSALAGGLLIMAWTTPALADSQNQGRLVQTKMNHGAVTTMGTITTVIATTKRVTVTWVVTTTAMTVIATKFPAA